jgi:hypothetical protein
MTTTTRRPGAGAILSRETGIRDRSPAVLDLGAKGDEGRLMELTELTPDERLALCGLLKAVVLADGKVSEDEMEEVEEIVDAFGEDAYRGYLDAFESRFPDEPSFQKFLKTITRQDARELIYGTILAGAAADAIEGGESDLLGWLAETWNIEITIAE